MLMTKKQAIAIITKCAKQYQQYLEGNQVVFVYRDENNKSNHTAVRFHSHNFLHFTGVTPRTGMNGIIMSMDTSARMIGNYTGPHLELYTEKVTGTTTACLGLIQSKDCYIPNSVLSEDIRSIVPKPPGKIFAIFKKPIGAPLYTQLTYKSKNISITKKCLPKELLTEVDTSLLEDNNNSDDNEPA